MTSIKAVLFDLDDTLVQTSKTRYAAVKYAGKKFFNKELSDEMIRDEWGKPFDEFAQNLFGAFDRDLIRSQYNSVIPLFPNEPYEDSHRVVSNLIERFPTGVVSSGIKDMVYDSLSVVGIPFESFFHIQTAEETTVHKPDPAVFDLVLEKLQNKGILKEEIVYVGDGPHDYLAAKGAGIQFYGISGRTTTKEVFTKTGAQTIDSLSELLELL